MHENEFMMGENNKRQPEAWKTLQSEGERNDRQVREGLEIQKWVR